MHSSHVGPGVVLVRCDPVRYDRCYWYMWVAQIVYIPQAAEPSLPRLTLLFHKKTEVAIWKGYLHPWSLQKWKGRASDTYLKQNSADKCSIVSGSLVGDVSNTAACTVLRPKGCKWSYNSCPFDSNLFVLYNLWRVNPCSMDCHVQIIRQPVARYSRRFIHTPWRRSGIMWDAKCIDTIPGPRVFVFEQEMSCHDHWWDGPSINRCSCK